MSDLFEDIKKHKDMPWDGQGFTLPIEDFYAHLEMCILGGTNQEIKPIADNVFISVFTYKNAMYAVTTEDDSWDDQESVHIYWPSLLKIKEL